MFLAPGGGRGALLLLGYVLKPPVSTSEVFVLSVG